MIRKIRNKIRYWRRKPPVPEFIERPYIRGTPFCYWLRQNQCDCGSYADFADAYILNVLSSLAGLSRYNKWCRKCYGLGIPPTPVNP